MLGFPCRKVIGPTCRILAGALVALSVLGSAPPAVPAESPHAWLPDELLVGFRAGSDDDALDATYRGHGAARLEKLRGLRVHRIRVAPAALEAVERALARRPEVQFVERNLRLQTTATPNDTYYPNQWHHPLIASPQAWDITRGAPGVVVAIVDTGVDSTHPDLSPNVVAGYNTYNNSTNSADVHGHGTAVAGIVAAAGNNGKGVAGLGWTVRIMPIRASDSSGSFTSSTVANAITWAADHGAKVINLSLGPVHAITVITQAAQYARSKGAVVVAAAGNCGCWDPASDNPFLISVSATTSSDSFATWSSRGNYVDVSAPAQIVTTLKGGGYGWLGGTSSATPVVAGVAALILSANPSLSPAQVETLIEANADEKGPGGWDPSFGFGRVNAYRAAAAAVASVPPPDLTPPTVSITSPASATTVSGTAAVSVAASDDVGVARVELYVDGGLLASDATSPFGFAWDTTTVANGSHTLVAKAFDAAGNQATSASVTVSVSNGADTIAPTTSISFVTKTGFGFRVGVAASDNVGVTRVELYVDGKLWGTKSYSPAEFNINTKSLAPGSHSLQSKAYDAAGNVGTSPGNTTFVK